MKIGFPVRWQLDFPEKKKRSSRRAVTWFTVLPDFTPVILIARTKIFKQNNKNNHVFSLIFVLLGSRAI